MSTGTDLVSHSRGRVSENMTLIPEKNTCYSSFISIIKIVFPRQFSEIISLVNEYHRKVILIKAECIQKKNIQNIVRNRQC